MTNERSDTISRRAALGAGGFALGMFAVPPVRSGLAQAADVPAVVQAFVDAWAALDSGLIAQTYATDGVREDVTAPGVVQGRDEIARSLDAFFAAFADARIEHPAILAGPAPYAADAWNFTGSYVGSLPGLPAGNGETVTIRGFTLIELAGNQITATTDYYDLHGILDQLDAESPEATPVGG